jgi:hypothetical protein
LLLLAAVVIDLTVHPGSIVELAPFTWVR